MSGLVKMIELLALFYNRFFPEIWALQWRIMHKTLKTQRYAEHHGVHTEVGHPL